MLATLLTSVLLYQDPAPSQQPPAQKVETQAPVEVWSDAKAKAAVTELQKQLKGNASLAQRTRALDAVATGSHKLLVKPLAQLVETDKALLVRQRAATLLGNQPAGDTTATILKLIQNERVKSYPAVQAELVRALARCGYTSKHWDQIDKLFERDYEADRVPLQEAILELVAQHKERRALQLLLRNLDEPAPANVDDPSNPPAEYWEARWKAWAKWRTRVKDALFAITGQRFTTAAEAKAWLAKNPV